jgi:hypothetical protein
VALVADAAQDPTLARRIASWFDKSPYRVEVETVPELDAERILSPASKSAARVWITVRGVASASSSSASSPGGRRARLYFVRGGDRGPATYLVRDIGLERGLDEMGAERIAEAIHFSVLALIEGGASTERSEVVQALETDAPDTVNRAKAADTGRPPTVARAPPALPRERRAVDVGLGYGAALRGDEGLGHGPRATVLVPLGGALAAAASIRTALPVKRALESVDLQLYGASLAVGMDLRTVSSKAASLDVSTGPGFDLVHYKPLRSSSVANAIGEEETEVRPTWNVGARATFDTSFRWALLAECSIALSRTHYDVSISGSRRTIGRPWTASPSIGLEIRF